MNLCQLVFEVCGPQQYSGMIFIATIGFIIGLYISE